MTDQCIDIQTVFRKMCLIRHFELHAAQAYEQKLTPGTVYLAVGQEAPGEPERIEEGAGRGIQARAAALVGQNARVEGGIVLALLELLLRLHLADSSRR